MWSNVVYVQDICGVEAVKAVSQNIFPTAILDNSFANKPAYGAKHCKNF